MIGACQVGPGETTMGPNGKGRPTPRIAGPTDKAPGREQPAPGAPVEPPPITVRPATDAVAMAAAALHAGQISQDFLSLVGPESLLIQWEYRSDPAGADAGPQ